MHELGIMLEIVRRVEQIAKTEHLTQVQRLVLQVGELSSVVPGYLRKCYPAAVSGSILEHTELVIESIPGNARCSGCGKVYRFLEHPSACPFCGGADKEMLSGSEFLIKEITAC